MDWGAFLSDYLAPILGFVGFIQLWALKAWDRFIAKPRLELHPSARIEFGFGGFGATLAFVGTLRAKNKPVFVKEMRAIVIRQSDGKVLDLSWRAFRANQVTIDPQHQQTTGLEVASSFMVRPESPHKYNVFLAGNDFQEALQPEVRPLQEKWKAFTDRQLEGVADNPGAQLLGFAQNPLVREKLFDQFRALGRDKEFVGRVNEFFYWKPGGYAVELIIQANASPEKISKLWWVEISEDESRFLRENSALVARELCNFTTTYNYVYKPYRIKPR